MRRLVIYNSLKFIPVEKNISGSRKVKKPKTVKLYAL